MLILGFYEEDSLIIFSTQPEEGKIGSKQIQSKRAKNLHDVVVECRNIYQILQPRDVQL